MKRHSAYQRYVLVLESEELTWIHFSITRSICKSCEKTQSLLPADIVAYCQYSLDVLMFLFCQIMIQDKSVPCVAKTNQLPVWSVYLVLHRYEICLMRMSLVLFELGISPTNHQTFTSRECFDEINRYGLRRFIYCYWQLNRRYLWQLRFHNRASPPVNMGFYKTGIHAFT